MKTLDMVEGEERIPLKGVHLNKSPALAPINTLTAEQAEKWHVNWGEININYDMLMADPDLITRLAEVYKQSREFEASDADSALYEGFISRDDRLRCNQLLAANPEELSNWTADSFQDSRLQALLFRYRARNYPQTLTEDESQRWMRFCQSRLIDGDFGAGLTLEQFQQQLLTLAQQELGPREQKLLNQLSLWVQSMAG